MVKPKIYDTVDELLKNSNIPLSFAEICQRVSVSERSAKRQLANSGQRYNVIAVKVLNRLVRYYVYDHSFGE